MLFQELKTHIRGLLLIVGLIVFFLLILAYITQDFNHKSVSKNRVIEKTSLGLPIRLKIPKIGVDTSIEYMGVTSKGEMEVPDNSINVGWFKLGPQPGEKGNAVIAGHFDGKNGEAGVFINLYKLALKDKIFVENSRGNSTAFVVREIKTYDPGYVNSVFSASESAHLNLITCDGVWNGAMKSYDKRLVVFTDILH